MADHSPRRKRMSWLSPYLTARNAQAIVALFEKAFGEVRRSFAAELDRQALRIELSKRDERILSEQSPTKHSRTVVPVATGWQSPVQVQVLCEDVDPLYVQAIAAGLEILSPPRHCRNGERVFQVRSPEGHTWSFASTTIATADQA